MNNSNKVSEKLEQSAITKVTRRAVSNKFSPERLALIVVCIILNLGIGFLVAYIKLPFYLDSIGTVIGSYLLGPLWGCAIGLATVLIGSIYTPTLWAYVFTAITIALYVSFAKKFGYLDKLLSTVAFGLGLGVASAIVSAPVTAILFSGISMSGTDVLTSLFRASGKSLMESVIYGGMASDPVDKLLTSIVAMLLIKRIHNSIIRRK